MADTAAELEAAIAAAAADPRPPHVALMHLLILAGGDPDLAAALERAATRRAESEPAKRLGRLAALLRERPDAARIVAEVMAEARHGAADPEDAVSRWTGIFDRLASRHPAASVALYSLGDEALLARASAEIVQWLAGPGLLGPDRDVLDLGCGIGRLTHALAPCCRTVVGADVSAGMLRQAAARGGGAPGVVFVRTSGRDLTAFGDDTFDLVLACDVFPYLVEAGPGAARGLVREIARVLRPGGEAAVLNLSYRGDEARDRDDAAAWSAAAGLVPVGKPERPFALWDGMAWRWRKPG